MKTFDNASGDEVNVYFPFLDTHPGQAKPYRTNTRQNQTFDQIGLFSRDPRLPTFEDNGIMGQNPRGPDYGVFNFVELFSQALFNAPFESLVGDAREDFLAKFQHKVSDHMPLWMRLPLPE